MPCASLFVADASERSKFVTRETAHRGDQIYQTAVTATGLGLWLIALASIVAGFSLGDQMTILMLVPLVVIVGMFPHTFPLPTGTKFTCEKITFTLSDAIILLVACWHGLPASVFIAGIEGFSSSRRAVRRLSSNLFSSGMMALSAAAASASLSAILRYAWHETGAPRKHTFPAIATGLLVASVVHTAANSGLLSTLLALRHGNSVIRSWKENFLLWAAPMFLPNGAAAILMYFTLQYDLLVTALIGTPVLLAIYLGHRQHRNSVEQHIVTIEKSHRETIEALAVAINAKDEVTHDHVMRVQIYSAGVARLLGCNESEIEALKAGALLHDIGKIAVPDYILNKPGKLTASEFEKMKMHTIIGAQILSRVEFPYPVVPIVRHHHERWDGKGYPDGLKAEEIPLTARVLTVVDCFDAVREDRQYRKGMTRAEAIDFLLRNSGSQYDPRVVGIFITHLPEFEAQIAAHKDVPLPTFGIEPVEQLSAAAREVPPAAGLAETAPAETTEQLNLSRSELSALYELVQSLGQAPDRAARVRVFTEKLRNIVPYDSCAVTLVAPETGDYTIAHAAGQHAALLMGQQVALGEGVTGWVLANGKPFCNTDPRLDIPPALAAHFAAYKTLAVFPLNGDEGLHGAVALYSSALAEYTQDQQRLLKEAAALLSNALSANPQTLPQTEPPANDYQATPTPLPFFQSPPIKLAEAPLESELEH